MVLVRSDRPLDYAVTGEGRVVIVHLRGAGIPIPTNRLPLDTRFFDSPVTGVTLKEHGGDLEISVALRGAATATPRKERGPGNSWYWILDVPGKDASRRSSAAGKTTTAAAAP